MTVTHPTSKNATGNDIEMLWVCGVRVIRIPHDNIYFQTSSNVKFALNAITTPQSIELKREAFNFKTFLPPAIYSLYTGIKIYHLPFEST